MQDLAPSAQELDALETRVAAVEARVFGAAGGGNTGERQQSAAEALTAAHSVLRTATAGREKVAAVVHRRFDELEGYLSQATSSTAAGEAEPGATAATAATAAALWPLVRCDEQTLRTAAAQLRRLTELTPQLDARSPAETEKMRMAFADLAASATRDRDAALKLLNKVTKLKEQHKMALDNVAQGVVLLEAQVSRLENAAKPRRAVD